MILRNVSPPLILLIILFSLVIVSPVIGDDCNSNWTSSGTGGGTLDTNPLMVCFGLVDLDALANVSVIRARTWANVDVNIYPGTYTVDILLASGSPNWTPVDVGGGTLKIVDIGSWYRSYEFTPTSVNIPAGHPATYIILAKPDKSNYFKPWAGGGSYYGYSGVNATDYSPVACEYSAGGGYIPRANVRTMDLQVCMKEPPLPNASLTATGTFCLGNEISFNLTDLQYPAVSGYYDIACYHNGESPAKYFDLDLSTTSPFEASWVLNPGSWSCMGYIDNVWGEDETWLNFSIASSCTPQTFNGTYNSSVTPWDVTNFTWYINNFNASAVSPWETPTFDNGNGTSFVDWMYSHGYINETEYGDVMTNINYYINLSANNSGLMMNYTYGMFSPLVMINDSISTVRANINGSYSVLSDGIAPISNIFTWVLQLIPSWILNLMTIGLTFDAVRIVLYARKN